jgi:succinate-semialdehyde dehydrogenase/glutarate-semialdehyde dehydrogenase
MNVDALLRSVPLDCYIAGDWTPAASGARFEVTDPATEKALVEVADASSTEALFALDAAAAAQERWAATSPRRRADLLGAVHREVLARTEEFAWLITLEMGKPLAESRAEVRYAADFLRWFSEQAVRIGGEYRFAPDGDARIVTLRQPVGPSLLVTPWNFPLAMIARKIGPALAAGCTTVIKPADQTPLAALLLVRVLHEVGVPAGVVNLLPTTRPADVSAPLLADPRLRKLSFTGSTPVGSELLAAAAPNVIRTSMELGGNSAFVVFADADLDAAADAVMLAKFRNGGESCVAANRLLVEASVRDEFTERVLQRVKAMRTGPGTAEGTDLGPVINDRQRDRISTLVAEAEASGAKILTGGQTDPGRRGHFYPPTVLSDVPDSARLVNEEIFGPILPISAFGTEDEAIAVANATPFGLVDYVCTSDVRRAVRVSEALEAGMVGINRGLVSNAAAPFGGVKRSGLGREGGFEGIEEYLDVKYLALDAS